MASGSEGQLIALMRLTPEQFQAAWRRGRITQWLGALFAWLLLAGVGVLFIVRSLTSTHMQTSELSQGDIISAMAYAALILLCVPLIVLFFGWLFMPPKSRWINSRVLRFAALAGESEQIPAVIDQVPPLASDERPHDVTPFRGLKMMMGINSPRTVFVGLFVLLMLGLVILNLTLFDVENIQTFFDFFRFIYILLIFGRVFWVVDAPGVFATGWRAYIPARRARLLAVDELGISWRARGWRTRVITLPWQDIGSFCVCRSKYRGRTTAYIYVLLGEREGFAWMVSAQGTEQQRKPSNLMCQMVATYARKPLLDITKFVETTQKWTPAESQRAFPKQSLDFGAVVQPAAHMPQQGFFQEAEFSGAPLRPVRLHPAFYLLNILLMLVVALGAGGFTVVNRQRQVAYYNTLSAQIAAETPLYSDSLTTTDYNWAVRQPTSTDSTSAQYAYGGYAMTGGLTGYTNEQTMDAQYIDAALAVTVRQIGSSDNDGVGLIARSYDPAGSEDDQIIFYISPTDGSWSLFHYQPTHSNSDDNWNYLDGGESSAIHQGDGATNCLLLVVRGTEYLCYINGQFVARDVDSTVTALSPKYGSPGVFVNDNATIGVFNDFAIYPAPPPYQPLLHG